MTFITIIIVSLYGFLILAFIVGFSMVKNHAVSNKQAQTKFSVLIPFRNEAEGLPDLLKSIEELAYPTAHYEIIFIDDDSDDDSVNIIKQGLDTKSVNTDFTRPDVRIVNNKRSTNSPKKDAIKTAIQQAKFDWIVTTDADCILPKNWLSAFDNFILDKHPKLIVAPVTYATNTQFLEQFQLLDLLSLQGVTIGGFGINKPFLCNGANLCYHKEAFFEVNGFEGNTTIASGDDIFLLEKIVQKYPDNVQYLKSQEAIVITKPQLTFRDLVQQRIRWASKSTAYSNNFSKLVSIAVLTMNFLLILLFFGSIFSLNSWQIFALAFLIKFILDLILLIKTSSFFKQAFVLKHYFLSSILYPIFTMFVVIASLKSGYSWKGRNFKK